MSVMVILVLFFNIGPGRVWIVYRRYSEFLALCEQLKTKGYVVPEMPPKRMLQFVSKSSERVCTRAARE